MRIGIIGSSYPYRGGIATYNERLAIVLQREGHDVIIYTFSMQYPDFFFPGKTQFSDEEGPVELNIVRCINSMNPLNWISIGNKIKRERHDLIIIGYWLPLMAPCFGTILRRIKNNNESIVIAIVHNMIPHESRMGDRLFTNYFVKPVDGFLAMSRSVIDDIGKFSPDKPTVLSPHPIYDHFGEIVPRESALEKLGLDPEIRYVLFFGLIRKYKGLDLLIEAFADERFRGRQIKLIIAGEYYADQSEYLELIKKHSLEGEIIQVNKFIPDSIVQDYFNACDLVVQPYRSATQSGVTQIAYHFNKPMIVTNVGGLEEMCPDGKVGYVVSTNPEAIANAMILFFENSDKQQFIDNIIEEKKKYSWDILTRSLFQLRETLVDM